jgi:predicted acetyltransferase
LTGLELPDPSLHVSFLAAMAEFRAEGRAGDDSSLGADLRRWDAEWENPAAFADYVAQVRAEAEPETPRPAGYVPATTFWWTDEAGYVGRISIRHRLTIGCARSAATSATTCVPAPAGADTRRRCCAPRCRSAAHSASRAR